MSNLTDEDLRRWSRVTSSTHAIDEPECSAIRDMAGELLRHRAAITADKERVRQVVRDVADALLTERTLFIVRPQQPTMNEIALEAYGHGRSCDAVALQGEELQAVLEVVANRCAEQLATSAVRP